jgi:hypothetical protein
MGFEVIDKTNLDRIIRTYSFKYDLCEMNRNRLKLYMEARLEREEMLTTMELEEICKLKTFNKKLKVIHV